MLHEFTDSSRTACNVTSTWYEENEDLCSVDNSHTLIQHVKVMMIKLQNVSEFIQMTMTAAQQLQEKYINKSWDFSEQYNVRDKVWLNLHNVKMNWSSKKLNACQQKFMILKQINSHAYCLNIISIHSVFSVYLLKSISSDLFSSQLHAANMSLAILIDRHEEWEIENILDEQIINRDKDKKSIKKYKIKWKENSKTC